jgi:hypothetical protein
MKKLIGIAIVILSIIGFFLDVTPDDFIDAPARTKLLAFIFTIPWYGKLFTLSIGVYLIISDFKRTKS